MKDILADRIERIFSDTWTHPLRLKPPISKDTLIQKCAKKISYKLYRKLKPRTKEEEEYYANLSKYLNSKSTIKFNQTK